MSKASGSIDLKSLKVAGEGASKYITEIDGDGIKVHAENNINVNYALINAEGMEIFQGNTAADSISMAKFGVVARIGTPEDANITIDNNSIVGVGASNKEFFAFEDSTSTINTSKRYTFDPILLRDFPYGSSQTGLSATLSDTPDTSSIIVYVKLITPGGGLPAQTALFTTGVAETIGVSFQNYPTIWFTYDGDKNFSNIKLSSGYTTDTTTAYIEIVYTLQLVAPSYKIGSEHRASGGYSYAEGYNNIAHGDYSHAEGKGTKAMTSVCHSEGLNTTAGTTTGSGNAAHSEGYDTVASGSYSHAEGRNTVASGQAAHAEGYNTIASNWYSHAEGRDTVASGAYSHAQNNFTVATEGSQTVIGKYNTATVSGSGTDADPYTYSNVGNYAFIIGNGTNNTTADRSNALTVDWDGNVNASGQYENLYKITTVQKVISGGINANSYEAAANITIPANTRPTGYNAVGIVGHASNYFRVQPTTNYVIDNTKIFAGFANWSATNVSADVTVTFYVLWLKATAAS